MYLDENLKLTPQSMSDKVTALDELEEMHQQVCIWGSFFYLHSFLFVVNREYQFCIKYIKKKNIICI